MRAENLHVTYPNGKKHVETTVHKIKRCSNSLFQNEYEKNFIARVLRKGYNAYCLEDENVKLQGIYDDKINNNEHHRLDIKIYRCSNATREPDDPLCESPDEIDKFLFTKLI